MFDGGGEYLENGRSGNGYLSNSSNYFLHVILPEHVWIIYDTEIRKMSRKTFFSFLECTRIR